MNREELLERYCDPIKVLDHGHVKLLDVMGDDAAIDFAARQSYQTGTRPVNKVRGLLRSLMRRRHTSPYEMCEFKIHVRMPIFVARQWVRHRTASLNEESGRYSEMKNEMFKPDQWRVQHGTDAQMSGGYLHPMIGQNVGMAQDVFHDTARQEYSDRLNSGVSRELARIDLPLSQYTSWVWKIDLHNLLHFLRLRMDEHAQEEIRVYAQAIARIVKDWLPITWKAFEDYRLNAVTFSAMEMKGLQALFDKAHEACIDPWGMILDESGLKGSELREFKAKLGMKEE